MASGVKTCCTIVILLLILNMKSLVFSEPQVPCCFIFGDSLLDNGNNNRLVTMAKANYSPYGIDFPDGPSGRFTNGRNTADFIAELLGFDDYISPFATAKGSEILRGVNYASGGAGIRDETGMHQGEVISLNRQLQNHQITVSSLDVLLGSRNAAKEYLSMCLYIVGMGNNDYINNYLLPQYYPASRLYSPDQFATLLIQQYSRQLKTMYNIGARKVAVFGLGRIGDVPMYRANGSAVMYINNAVQLFNDKLKQLLDDLNHNSDAKFLYLNTSSISDDASSSGITVFDEPCCKVSKITGMCIPGDVPCSNRGEYAFWDNFHPAENFNQITASRAYISLLPTDAHPFDISHLVQYSSSSIKEVYSLTESDLDHQSS